MVLHVSLSIAFLLISSPGVKDAEKSGLLDWPDLPTLKKKVEYNWITEPRVFPKFSEIDERTMGGLRKGYRYIDSEIMATRDSKIFPKSGSGIATTTTTTTTTLDRPNIKPSIHLWA